MKKKLTVDLSDCPRCGGKHKDIRFVLLKSTTQTEFNYWAKCPITKQPIMMAEPTEQPKPSISVRFMRSFSAIKNSVSPDTRALLLSFGLVFACLFVVIGLFLGVFLLIGTPDQQKTSDVETEPTPIVKKMLDDIVPVTLKPRQIKIVQQPKVRQRIIISPRTRPVLIQSGNRVIITRY